jgi:glycosyltransferase involved in cell wall biosynthesis
MVAHHLFGMRMRAWFRLLRIYRQIDLILLSARPHYDFAVAELGVPVERVRLSEALCIVDSDHYAPRPGDQEEDRQICAIGVEYRDYATLFAAITTLPARLKVDAHSPWSMLPDPILGLEPPSNVELYRLEFGAARRLYAASGIVAIPLHPNDKGAGTTTLLEAMSMGKAVVVTRTTGNPWALDGETVLTVEPGDVEGWRRALARLLQDGALRRRLGTNARRWIEANAACDLRALQIAATLRG